MALQIMSTADLVAALEQQRRYLDFLLQVKAGKLSSVSYGPETDEEIDNCAVLTARILAMLALRGELAETAIVAEGLPF